VSDTCRILPWGQFFRSNLMETLGAANGTITETGSFGHTLAYGDAIRCINVTALYLREKVHANPFFGERIMTTYI